SGNVSSEGWRGSCIAQIEHVLMLFNLQRSTTTFKKLWLTGFMRFSLARAGSHVYRSSHF
ncbi:MAG TPA: hypothetical protein VFL79_15745, partial [Terriglobia bacterium]|nr:hypothetical protein [Terriglobia bacterium]